MTDPTRDQPPPVPSASPAVWDLVIADMRERDRVGRERYGTPLQVNNGRDALRDLAEELLDAVVYARQLRERLTALGLDLLRVYALLAAGDAAEALTLLDSAIMTYPELAARPPGHPTPAKKEAP